MLNQETTALIEQARKNMVSFVREGQGKVEKDLDKIIKSAQNVENRQTEGQTALQEGDVFTVPQEDADFNSCLISRTFSEGQTTPSIGLFVVVTRKQKPVVVQVYSSAFTRGQYVYDSNGEVATEMTYPEGEPAKDVRNTPGSVLDALSALKGKTIKVEAVLNPECRVLKRGAVRDTETGRFGEDQFEKRKTRILSFNYIESTPAQS